MKELLALQGLVTPSVEHDNWITLLLIMKLTFVIT